MSQSIELEADIIEKGIQKRNKILADAEEKVQKILKTSETEVARINSDVDKQILQIVGSELKTVRLRIIGQTELQGKKALMDKRSELLSEIYKHVDSRVKNIVEGKSKDQNYSSILEKLIVEGISAINDTEIVISANKRDLEYLKKNIKKIAKSSEGVDLKIDDNPIDTIGGVVLKSAKGNKIFYNTFEGRLARVRSNTEGKIAKILGMI